jgi:hypothetical protein
MGISNLSFALMSRGKNLKNKLVFGRSTEIGKPVLELQFDHNLHSLNQELLETFIRHIC